MRVLALPSVSKLRSPDQALGSAQKSLPSPGPHVAEHLLSLPRPYARSTLLPRRTPRFCRARSQRSRRGYRYRAPRARTGRRAGPVRGHRSRKLELCRPADCVARAEAHGPPMERIDYSYRGAPRRNPKVRCRTDLVEVCDYEKESSWWKRIRKPQRTPFRGTPVKGQQERPESSKKLRPQMLR